MDSHQGSPMTKNDHLVRYRFGRGQEHPNWKGGRRYANNGYIWVYSPDHPKRTSQNRVLEHRLVMEEHLGRYLSDGEVIHHINNKRDDNRIENLMLTTSGHNVAISNAGRLVTESYRAKRSEIAKRIKRGPDGRFTRADWPRGER